MVIPHRLGLYYTSAWLWWNESIKTDIRYDIISCKGGQTFIRSQWKCNRLQDLRSKILPLHFMCSRHQCCAGLWWPHCAQQPPNILQLLWLWTWEQKNSVAVTVLHNSAWCEATLHVYIYILLYFGFMGCPHPKTLASYFCKSISWKLNGLKVHKY